MADDMNAERGHGYGELLNTDSWTADASPTASETDAAPPSALHIIEALLFVGGAPLTASRAGMLIRGLTPGQFGQVIDELTTTYRRQGRPYAVQPRGPGFVLALRPR